MQTLPDIDGVSVQTSYLQHRIARQADRDTVHEDRVYEHD
jgi:hypothetical protein